MTDETSILQALLTPAALVSLWDLSVMEVNASVQRVAPGRDFEGVNIVTSMVETHGWQLAEHPISRLLAGEQTAIASWANDDGQHWWFVAGALPSVPDQPPMALMCAYLLDVLDLETALHHFGADFEVIHVGTAMDQALTEARLASEMAVAAQCRMEQARLAFRSAVLTTRQQYRTTEGRADLVQLDHQEDGPLPF